MGYNSGTKKITAPVGIADVQHALGDASTDVGSLCKSANINMWAKYKPVVKNLINTYPQLKSDLTWKNINGSGGLGNDAWFKGTDLNFGITPKYVGQTGGAGNDRMINVLYTIANTWTNGGMNGWYYTRPSGGSSAPYRLIDFNGYNVDAVEPIKSISSIDSTIYTVPASGSSPGSAWAFEYQIMGSADAGATSIAIDNRDYLLVSDIVGTCYLGLAIYKKTNDGLRDIYTAIAWATGMSWSGSGFGQNTSVGENYVSAQFMEGETYYALPLFFSEQLPQEQTVAGQVKPYPNWSMQPSTNFKVWTIPYTTFIPFVLRQASTRQSIGFPTISNKKILPPVGTSTNGAYATRVYVDSSYSSYYTGGTISSLYVGVVNELWDGVWNVGDSANSHIAQITDSTVLSIPANTKKQVYSWGSGGNHALLALDLSHTWRVIIRINGEDYDYELMTTIDPNAPVSQ